MIEGFRLQTGTTAAASSVVTITGSRKQRIYLLALGYNPTTATTGLVKWVVQDGSTAAYSSNEKQLVLPVPTPLTTFRDVDILSGITAASADITSDALFDATNTAVGTNVTGPGVPAGTTVAVRTDASNITLSNPIDAGYTGNFKLSFWASNSLVATVTATGGGNTTGYAIYAKGP